MDVSMSRIFGTGTPRARTPPSQPAKVVTPSRTRVEPKAGAARPRTPPPKRAVTPPKRDRTPSKGAQQVAHGAQSEPLRPERKAIAHVLSMSWSVAEPSFSSGSPESSDQHVLPGDLAKIPTSDTLVITPEELRDKSKTDGKGPVMHKVVIPPQRRAKDHNRSPSREMSPILRTRRSQIPSRLLSPIALSMPSRASLGDLQRVTSLLRAGCWVHDTDSCKCTALMYAATSGHVAIAHCLVEHAANVNAQSHDKWTPLIAAAYNGHVSMADFLVSRGADVEYADERGWTALMHVAFNGRQDIVRCLLQYGARVEREDKEGRTALVYAAFGGHLEIVKCFLAYGRLQSGKWHLGGDGAAQLAMMFAADKGHAHVVQAFLDASLASAPTKRSALELANANGHHQVVQLLQSDQVQEGVAK
eukprot:g31920.t1